MTAINRKLLRDLGRMRGQAVAIALVIAGGVATLVTALGTISSLEDTRTAFYQRYRFAHIFARARRAPQHLAPRIADIPGVMRTQTRIAHDVLVDVAGLAEPARGRLLSLPTDGRPALNDIVVRTGRGLRTGHVDEVIVNVRFAEANDLVAGDTVSANINGKRRRLRIVGTALSPEFVYAISPGEVVPDNRRFGVLWMSRTALEAAFDLKSAFNDVSLALRRDAVAEDVVARLDDLLEPFGGTGGYSRREHVSDAFLRSELEQLRLMARVLPPIFLGVAAFLLNIVVARLVETEREQIGILKAFGYSNAAIGWTYLKLVLAIVLAGVVSGWILGAWMGHGMTGLYADYFGFPFLRYTMAPSVFAIAGAVGILAAAGGALFAVRRATRLAPAVAMQPPPPTIYGRSSGGGFLQTFVPQMRIRPATRMLLRHIARWPARSLLTCAGMAFAVALLVSSLFFFDAIDEMMDAFFSRTQRQDVTISFTEPRSENVLYEVAALPGVLAAELYRAVPVRLRHGHHSRLVALTGIDEGADLSRLVDVHDAPVALPPAGLVLTSSLAKLLGAGAGSTIDVEVLEGSRPTRTLPVGAVVEEFVGTAAYLSRGALTELMRESPAASGAHLLVDPLTQRRLFQQLKATPLVQSVSVQGTTLATFRAIVDETMGAMASFYVLFASMIAIGVVYNAGRLSLSERARELASLRVLGFTLGEIAYVLLGELALLTLLALPLGCLLGYGIAAYLTASFDTELMRLPLVILPATYGYSMLVVIAATTVTSLVVARRLARLDLVAVLKARE